MKSQPQPEPYFQHQKFYSFRCGLHAVNNFLGQKVYTENQFDSICQQLQQQSNQKYQHFIGGDYDVSVLIKALHLKNYQIVWHDSRKQFEKTSASQEKGLTLEGYLVNINNQKFYHKLLGVSGRHWISVKLVKNDKGELVYKMDSSDKKVETMDEKELFRYLQMQRNQGAQILKVFKQTKAQND